MLQIEDYSPSLTYLDSNVTKLAMCAIVLWWGAGLASGEELKIRITLSERAIKSIQSGLKDATLGISWEDQVQGVGVSVDELKVDSNRKAKILIKVPKPGRYTLYGAIGNSLSGSTELPLGVLRVNGKKAGDWSFREYQHVPRCRPGVFRGWGGSPGLAKLSRAIIPLHSRAASGE